MSLSLVFTSICETLRYDYLSEGVRFGTVNPHVRGFWTYTEFTMSKNWRPAVRLIAGAKEPCFPRNGEYLIRRHVWRSLDPQSRYALNQQCSSTRREFVLDMLSDRWSRKLEAKKCQAPFVSGRRDDSFIVVAFPE
jgi:hypothetical protein